MFKVMAVVLAVVLVAWIGVRGRDGAEGEIVHVSLVELLGRPEAFDGKQVRIKGYLHAKFEDCGLYMGKEQADHLMGKYGVWISIKEEGVRFQPEGRKRLEEFDGQYVLVEGVFNMKGHGHLGAFGGEVREVGRVMELTRYYDGGKDFVKGK